MSCSSVSVNLLRPHHNYFTALFPGPSGLAGVRRKLLLDFMVLGRITRGRHTDSLGWRHSIRTNQQSTSINPLLHFYAGCPSCRNPTNLSSLGTGTGICWIAYTLPWLHIPRGLSVNCLMLQKQKKYSSACLSLIHI